MPMLAELGKIAAMAVTVIATSGDDALWLVPFVASPTRSASHRFINGIVWTCTLVGIVGVSYLFVVFGNYAGEAGWLSAIFGPTWPAELCLSFIGLVLVWIICLIMLVKYILKQRKKAARKKAQLAQKQQANYKAVESGGVSSPKEETKEDPTVWGDFCKIVLLTITGGLDEVAYFPSLLLTNTYTIAEMCLGTLVACILLWAVLVCALGSCKPILEAMDKIPMWAFVAFYGVILTVMFVVEWSELPKL